jgi:hypothetical protein
MLPQAFIFLVVDMFLGQLNFIKIAALMPVYFSLILCCDKRNSCM